MKILVTNDDGYNATGIRILTEIVRPMGEVTVVAPKHHQSGMAMAVNLGYKPIAVKKLSETPSERSYYLSGTHASCVKYALNILYSPGKLPGLVISGINHGGNYSSAGLYSGTLGAAMEGALLNCTAIAVSLDNLTPEEEDFDIVRAYLPRLIEKLTALRDNRFGVVYNINFPAVRPEECKGVRVTCQGVMRWVREFRPFVHDTFRKIYPDPEISGLSADVKLDEGEELVAMIGEVVLDPSNPADCDLEMIRRGYITINAINLDNTDAIEQARLKESGIEE